MDISPAYVVSFSSIDPTDCGSITNEDMHAYLSYAPNAFQPMIGDRLDPNAVNEDGKSLLMAAIECGREDLACMLVEQGGADLNYIQPSTGMCPLVLAARYNCINFLALVSLYEVNPDRLGLALKQAIDLQQQEACRALLDLDIDLIHHVYEVNGDKVLPIHVASAGCCLSIALMFIEIDPSLLNKRSGNQFLPLDFAIQSQNEPTAKIFFIRALIEKGGEFLSFSLEDLFHAFEAQIEKYSQIARLVRFQDPAIAQKLEYDSGSIASPYQGTLDRMREARVKVQTFKLTPPETAKCIKLAKSWIRETIPNVPGKIYLPLDYSSCTPDQLVRLKHSAATFEKEFASLIDSRKIEVEKNAFLFKLVKGRQLNLIQVLIHQYQADVNHVETSDPKDPAIIYAFKQGFLEVVQLLLDCGADPNVSDSSGNPFLFLVLKDKMNASLLEQLFAAGANPNTVKKKGISVLMMTAGINRINEVNFLLEKGASIDLKDLVGRTALHHACGRLQIQAAKSLALRGASITMTDVNGMTPLDFLPSFRDDLKKLLIQASETYEQNLTF